MAEKFNKDIYAIISSVLLAIFVCVNYKMIINLLSSLDHVFAQLEIFILYFSVFMSMILCILLIIRKKNKVLYLCSILFVSGHLINYFLWIQSINSVQESILGLISYASVDFIFCLYLFLGFTTLMFFVIYLVILCVDSLQNLKIKLQKIWFIPIVGFLIVTIISFIEKVYPTSGNFVFLRMFRFETLQMLAAIFLMLWIYDVDLRNLFNKNYVKLNTNQTIQNTSNLERCNINNSNGTSDTDKLRAYKELLDYGAITNEEFEKKKKEIIGE